MKNMIFPDIGFLYMTYVITKIHQLNNVYIYIYISTH